MLMLMVRKVGWARLGAKRMARCSQRRAPYTRSQGPTSQMTTVQPLTTPAALKFLPKQLFLFLQTRWRSDLLLRQATASWLRRPRQTTSW